MKAEFRLITFLALVVVSVGDSACSRRDAAATNADPLAHGKQVVQRMSDALAAAPAFTVTTHEVRDAVHSDGSIKHLTLDHQVTVRRPDRLYVKTTGDRQTEAWYDGAGITVLSHADKVFGQAPMPETIDRTIDALHERYGFYVPGSDMYHSSPAHALLTDTTTGGWVGLETISGQSCDHVAFEDRGVKWEIWVPANGTALPLRTKAEFPNVKRIRNFEISFSDWNLSPAIAADRFTPKVPADYEGIAMIQRAAVMANIPDQPATASDPKK